LKRANVIGSSSAGAGSSAAAGSGLSATVSLLSKSYEGDSIFYSSPAFPLDVS